MDKAGQAGRIDGEPVIFATNRLVIITPVDNPANITAPIDLSNANIKLVLAAPDVPAREYADEMLDKIAADPAYGDGFKAAVFANLVSEETTVRHVVTKVSLGEADAGIVYSSDVTPNIADTLFKLEVPDEFNVLASYPMAVVEGAPNAAAAKSFIDFVLSEAGQAILKKWGFGSIEH
jgi:molybdate transport system substrate-binding protein